MLLFTTYIETTNDIGYVPFHQTVEILAYVYIGTKIILTIPFKMNINRITDVHNRTTRCHVSEGVTLNMCRLRFTTT
jgi:hypothetical protein